MSLSKNSSSTTPMPKKSISPVEPKAENQVSPVLITNIEEQPLELITNTREGLSQLITNIEDYVSSELVTNSGEGSSEFISARTSVETKISQLREVPISPNPTGVEQEITHSHHPQHQLVRLSAPLLFTCKGCKEYGAGGRFTCKQCKFDLHEFCHQDTSVVKFHPFHPQHELFFHTKPDTGYKKLGINKPKCNMCGKSTKGYALQCKACNFWLHPCCSMLSSEMNFPVHPHSLKLIPDLRGESGDSRCSECELKRSLGQAYKCMECEYYLHVGCAKCMVNGLHDIGVKGQVQNRKNKKMKVVVKIVGKFVLDLLKAFVKGIGEGIGFSIVHACCHKCHDDDD